MNNKKKIVLGVRFDEETYRLIEQVAEAQGLDKSDFVRRAVRKELARLSFLSKEQKKALEVS